VVRQNIKAPSAAPATQAGPTMLGYGSLLPPLSTRNTVRTGWPFAFEGRYRRGAYPESTMLRYFALIGVFAVAAGVLPHQAIPLRVRYLRFAPAPHLDGAPSTTLKVGLSNEGGDDLTQIVVRISISAKSSSAGVSDRLAGPYTLKGQSLVLRPGQTLNFELTLKNLTADCRCVAHVNVLSAQPIRATSIGLRGISS
jgi:hypothetical protein